MNTRSLFWDVFKGLGIIAIVTGHVGWFGGRFVYLFHLALFFYATGWMYRPEKYAQAPFLYFSQRLRGVWPRYQLYTLLFVLMHNFFVRTAVYPGSPLWTRTDLLQAWTHNLVLACAEPVQAAMWFVPVWLVSAGLFGACVWAACTLPARFSTRFSPAALPVAIPCPVFVPCLVFILCLLFGYMGLILHEHDAQVAYNLETALLVMPVYAIGMISRRLTSKISVQTPAAAALWLLSGGMLWFIAYRLHIVIDLAVRKTAGAATWLIFLIGIIHISALARVLLRLPIAANIIARLGRRSFDIMALHFLVFKLMDLGYARILLRRHPSLIDTITRSIGTFPVGFRPALAPWYIFGGLLFPALAGHLLDRLGRK